MSIKLALHINDQHPALRFAAEELRRFLGSGVLVAEQEANFQLHVRVDAALPPYAFAIEAHENGTIVLSGHDESCALHAVYTWLEKLGWRFEIAGARWIQDSDLEAQFKTVIGWSAQFQPAVLKRIRAEYGSGQVISSAAAVTFDAPSSPIAQEESH